MDTLASLGSDRWTTCPELVDDFIGIRSEIVEAFTAVLGLAYPFGSLLDRVRILAPSG
jgi:hypothetical protein